MTTLTIALTCLHHPTQKVSPIWDIDIIFIWCRQFVKGWIPSNSHVLINWHEFELVFSIPFNTMLMFQHLSFINCRKTSSSKNWSTNSPFHWVIINPTQILLSHFRGKENQASYYLGRRPEVNGPCLSSPGDKVILWLFMGAKNQLIKKRLCSSIHPYRPRYIGPLPSCFCNEGTLATSLPI